MQIKDIMEAMIDIELFEAFDDPEKLTHNQQDSDNIKQLTGASYLKVHDTSHPETQVIEFIHKNAAEVHIMNRNHKVGHIGRFSGGGASRLLSSVAGLYKQHLDAGRKVRFIGYDGKSNRLYKTMFSYLNKKHYNNSLEITEKTNHTGLDGYVHPVAYEVSHNKQKLQLQESN